MQMLNTTTMTHLKQLIYQLICHPQAAVTKGQQKHLTRIINKILLVPFYKPIDRETTKERLGFRFAPNKAFSNSVEKDKYSRKPVVTTNCSIVVGWYYSNLIGQELTGG